MPTESFVRRRLQSFRYAARGIAEMIGSEPNARIHVVATALVVLTGLAFDIERLEWLSIVLAIGGVFCAEGFNTAFEALCDVASPVHDPRVQRAKDVAAGAVLLSVLAAVAVGVIVFGGRCLLLLVA